MIQIKHITDSQEAARLLLEIRNAQWSPASEIDPRDYNTENIGEYIKSEDRVFCVAYHDDAFSGMASGQVLRKPNGEKWLYIDEVDVCEDRQRNGIGTALMRFLLDYAQEKRCEEVWLGTETDNAPANALYRSLDPSEITECIGYTYKISP